MSKDPIRTGVLGYGLAGRIFHVPFIQALADFELRAVATSRAEAQADLPGVRIVAEAEAILNAEDIDLVVIATPHRLHVPQALAALAGGKHVIIEKPAATSISEVNRLKEASTKADRLAVPFQNRRWDGDFQALRKLIQSGLLGRVHHFETQWPMFRPQPRGVWRDVPDELGGVLNDLGPHLIDQTLLLFGMPEMVDARVSVNRAGCSVDDAFRIQFTYANGLYALLAMDVLNGGTVPRYTLRGANGTLEKFGVDPQEAALRAGIQPGSATWGQVGEKARLVYGGAHGLSIQGEMEIPPGDYRDFFTAVARAIRGEASAPVTLDELLRQMIVLEAVRESAQRSAPVKVSAP